MSLRLWFLAGLWHCAYSSIDLEQKFPQTVKLLSVHQKVRGGSEVAFDSTMELSRADIGNSMGGKGGSGFEGMPVEMMMHGAQGSSMASVNFASTPLTAGAARAGGGKFLASAAEVDSDHIDHTHSSGMESDHSETKSAKMAFCNAEMASTMLMSGFSSVFRGQHANQPCLVFLVEGAILDTPTKFLIGCCFALWIGVLSEYVLFLQRRTPGPTPGSLGPCYLRPAAQKMLLHVMMVVMGYLLMLLVMTYSVEITVSGIAGLCIGRYIFGGSPDKKGMDSGGGRSSKTPCCQD